MKPARGCGPSCRGHDEPVKCNPDQRYGCDGSHRIGSLHPRRQGCRTRRFEGRTCPAPDSPSGTMPGMSPVAALRPRSPPCSGRRHASGRTVSSCAPRIFESPSRQSGGDIARRPGRDVASPRRLPRPSHPPLLQGKNVRAISLAASRWFTVPCSDISALPGCGSSCAYPSGLFQRCVPLPRPLSRSGCVPGSVRRSCRGMPPAEEVFFGHGCGNPGEAHRSVPQGPGSGGNPPLPMTETGDETADTSPFRSHARVKVAPSGILRYVGMPKCKRKPP